MSISLLNPYLDFKETIVKSGHNLPHWHQDNKLQFVTFRLADSLPQYILTQLLRIRNDFIDTHPKPWDSLTKSDFSDLITPKQQRFLDNGFGSCILRNPEYRSKLVESIEYYNGLKYDIIAYVIMPNHVHLLYSPIHSHTNLSLIGNIKRNSSILINRLTNNTGKALWAKGYWDTLIRNYHHLEKCISYIIQNPRNLKAEDYSLYVK